MRRSFGYQQEAYVVHEESWHSENEHYSYGSGMNMLCNPCSPKQSKHQLSKLNGSNDMFQDGWNASGAHLGSNGVYQDGWIASGAHLGSNGMYQDSWHGENKFQNGWNASGSHLNHSSGGKYKPHSDFTDAQFPPGNKPYSGSGYGATNGSFHQVHFPSQAVTMEEVQYQSSWEINGGGRCQELDNHYKVHNGRCNEFGWMP